MQADEVELAAVLWVDLLVPGGHLGIPEKLSTLTVPQVKRKKSDYTPCGALKLLTLEILINFPLSSGD